MAAGWRRGVSWSLALLAVVSAGCGLEVPETRPTSRVSAPSPLSESSSTASPTAAPVPRARVIEVIDGDTIEVALRGRTERVRLIGINTPESGECFAAEASDRLAELVAGRQVRLEADVSDRDQYDRLLRYVHRDGQLVNETLVAEGYALARRYPPDVAHAPLLEDAQARAERHEAGLWRPGACVSTGDSDLALTVQPDAPGDDNANLNGEWVEIRNRGDEEVALGGWSVKDESATHRYRFGDGVAVAPGASLRLHTGCGTDTAVRLHWCRRDSAVWNNAGDTAFLLDPAGRVVARHRYP